MAGCPKLSTMKCPGQLRLPAAAVVACSERRPLEVARARYRHTAEPLRVNDRKMKKPGHEPNRTIGSIPKFLVLFVSSVIIVHSLRPFGLSLF
jgi:hypothetical protein